MRIIVRASGMLRDLPPFAERGEQIVVELPAPASIRAVIAAAGVNSHLVMAVAFAGQRRHKDDLLTGDGELLLIPPLAGG